MMSVMSFSDWREPVRILKEQTGPVAAKQRDLGAQVGFLLDGDLPRGVAAAMLEEHLHSSIWGIGAQNPSPATLKQREFLEAIANGRSFEPVSLSKNVASAWIGHYLAVRTADSLERLHLRAGDQVTHQSKLVDYDTGELHAWSDRYVVSSIGARGLVYFKGGNGKCGWPANLSRSSES